MFGPYERNYEDVMVRAVASSWSPGSWEPNTVVNNKLSEPVVPNTSLMSDLLVAVATSRDKEAFSQLFSHYAPRLKSYLMKQGTSNNQAEELSQEAMLSVWRKADRFDRGKASAGTWIFTVARNLRIDAIRKETRPSFDPNDPFFVHDDSVAPDGVLEVKENSKKIRSVLSQLSNEQEEVVRLSFFEDKAHPVIASELNIPLGTVKSRIRLAIQKVRELMGEQL
jgi:RNA polymerase sigma factor (sigma-70 family)